MDQDEQRDYAEEAYNRDLMRGGDERPSFAFYDWPRGEIRQFLVDFGDDFDELGPITYYADPHAFRTDTIAVMIYGTVRERDALDRPGAADRRRRARQVARHASRRRDVTQDAATCDDTLRVRDHRRRQGG